MSRIFEFLNSAGEFEFLDGVLAVPNIVIWRSSAITALANSSEVCQVEKEYLVRVSYQMAPQRVYEMPGADTRRLAEPITQDVRAIFPPALLARLRHGLSLDGQALKPALVDWQNPEQLRFVLKEGKKRQIRRMCEAVGLHVTGLKRVRIGGVALGQLPVGQWRYLGANEQF